MIWIELNKRDFEYDIHSLVKAFFAEKDVSIADCDAGTVELKISVFYEQKSIRIRFSDPDGNTIREGITEIDIGKDRKETKNALTKGYVVFTQFILEVFLFIGGAILLGLYLDKLLNTKCLFLLIFIMLFGFVPIYNLVKRMNVENK